MRKEDAANIRDHEQRQEMLAGEAKGGDCGRFHVVLGLARRAIADAYTPLREPDDTRDTETWDFLVRPFFCVKTADTALPAWAICNMKSNRRARRAALPCRPT